MVDRKVAPATPGGIPVVKGPPRLDDVDRGVTLPPWWGPSGKMVTPKDSRDQYGAIKHQDGFVPIGYGEIRVGGDELWGTLPDFGNASTLMTFFIVWCDGEIDAITAVKMNGRTQVAYLDSWDNQHGTALTNHRGAPGDTAAAEGWPNGATWDSSGWGVPVNPSYTKIVYTGVSSGYINPWWYYVNRGLVEMFFQADIRGRKIYDPRLDSTNGGSGPQRYTDATTWAYSNNPALVYRDLLTFYGKVPNAMVDDVSITVAADACDDSGFACNIVFSKQGTLDAAIDEVLLTCCGYRTLSDGKYGLWLDVLNEADPVLYFDEEAGSISEIRYEWVPAADRPTYVSVKFQNAAGNYKDDAVSSPETKPDGVTVPLRELVVNVRGCTTTDQAKILADYLYAAGGKTLRIHATFAFEGISLVRGMKVHVTTLSGVDTEFLVEQITAAGDGFYAGVVKPYDEVVYDTTPTIQPPPTPPDPPDPNDTPPDLEDVVEADAQAMSIDSDGSTKTIVEMAGFRYSLPDWPFLFQIVARAISTWDEPTRDAATWASMAASEFIIPLNGNLPPPDATTLAATLTGFQVGEEIIEYGSLNEVLSDVYSRPFSRIIVKAQSQVGNFSSGVTLDGAAISSGGGVLPPGAPAFATIITLKAGPLPALSDTAQARIVLDEADMTIKASVNAGAYKAIGAGGTGGALGYLDLADQTIGAGGLAKNWQGLACGAGTLVAVGVNYADGAYNAGVFVSTDGTTWTEYEAAEETTWYDVAYGAGLFVAVSSYAAHRVMTSADGTSWTSRDAAGAYTWSTVIFADGRFVALAAGTSKAMTSTDGIAWTLRDMGVAEYWRGIAYGAGLYVAIAQGTTGTRVITSPDGVTWTARACGDSADNLASIAFGGGIFLILPSSTGANAFHSTDGIAWTEKTNWGGGAGVDWRALTHDGAHFLALGRRYTDGTTNWCTTVDGETGSFQNFFVDGTKPDSMWIRTLWVSGLSLYVAVGYGNSYTDGWPRAMSSADHSTWTDRTPAGAEVAKGPAGTLRVISANGGVLETSYAGGDYAPISGAPTRLTSKGGSPTITGTINGTNVTFTSGSAAGSVFLVIVDGLPDVDATWTATTITTSVAPRSSVVAFTWG